MELTAGDVKYYRNLLEKDKSAKRIDYDQRIEPDRIMMYYEGSRKKSVSGLEVSNDIELSRIALNKIFPATQTLISTLYPANPGFVCSPKKETTETRAKIAQAAMNYYFDEMGSLKEIQSAILNAWLFGFGVVKQGWRTVFRKPARKVTVSETASKNKLVTVAERMGIESKPVGDVNMETPDDEEFIAIEEPFLYCPQNKDIFLDSDQPFGKEKRVTEHFKKTLYDLRNSELYTLSDDFLRKFKNKPDEREVELDIYEMYFLQPDGVYLLVLCDGWTEPLRFDKMPHYHEGLPYTFLRLNMEPEVTYPVPAMKVAQRLHTQADYLFTIWLQHIRKSRNMDVFWEDAFDDASKNAIRRNEIGGQAFSNKPLTSGVYQHIGGSTIPADHFKVLETLMQNIDQVLTIVGARLTGESEQDTATQEKIADYGNTLRTATMQDQVNHFIERIGLKLLQTLKQFATAPVLLKVTGMNETDPMTGEPIIDEWIEFATEESPFHLKDFIQGDYDIDIDVTNLARRDLGLIRRQMMEILGIVGQEGIMGALQLEGKRFKVAEFIEDLIDNFETLSNAGKYFEQMPQQPMLGAGGAVPPEAAGMLPPPVAGEAPASPQVIGAEEGV